MILEERTALFGEAVIDFGKKFQSIRSPSVVTGQLVGAGTNVCAKYCEADDADSKKDYRARIGTCKKKSRESKFFIRYGLVRGVPNLRNAAAPLWQEAKELHLIFAKIYNGEGPTTEVGYLGIWVFRL